MFFKVLQLTNFLTMISGAVYLHSDNNHCVNIQLRIIKGKTESQYYFNEITSSSYYGLDL